MSTPDDEKVAREIADDLFHNGVGQEADRLVLTLQPNRDIGGWCKQAVVDRIASALSAAREPVAEMKERCAETVEDFDGWVSCTCSECRADAGSHAVRIGASMEALAAAIRNLPAGPQENQEDGQ